MSDKDQLYALCEDLFTIREMKETSQRLSVARLLDAGKPYTAIAEATGRVCDDNRSRFESA